MPQKILIIGPSWVGDTIMSQSLFKLIKQRAPHTTIDVLAPAWTFSLFSCMPEIANTIPMPITHGELKLRTRYQIGKQLREHHYDQAIVLPNTFKSALIPWIARIPKRTGWLGECRYMILNDARRLDKKRYPLMVQQYIALGLAADEALPEKIIYPEFVVTKAAQEAALHQLSLSANRPILALGAGAEFGPSKRWPEEYFAEVAKQKIKEGWDVWLLGSPNDRKVTDHIMEMTSQQCINIAGRTDLSQTIALLSLASGVVTNDSGLMHMAAALQKPLIAIYGSTSPSFTPPLSSTAKIIQLNLECQPCFQRDCPLKHHRCMKDIKPEQILLAMQEWT